MTRQKLLMLLALLMATQSLLLHAVVDDVRTPCPLSCYCYRQVNYTLLQPTGVLDAKAFIISLRGFSSSTMDNERP